MSKNSVSEWSTVSSGNGDIAGLTLGLDMPPSYVNNAMQEMMAQIKQWKDGYTDPISGLPVYQSSTVENIQVEGDANLKGNLTLNGNSGTAGQVIVSSGSSATPAWQTIVYGSMATQDANNVNITGGAIKTTGALNVTGLLEMNGAPGSVGQVLMSKGSGGVPQWSSVAIPDSYTKAQSNAINSAQDTKISANTAKKTNATHSGDVTGSTTLTIGTGKVTNAKLGSNSVTASKIASNAVTSSQIAPNSVGSSEIIANTVRASELNVSGNGNTSQYLRADGDGTFTWATPPGVIPTTYGAIGTYGILSTTSSFANGQTTGTIRPSGTSGTWRVMGFVGQSGGSVIGPVYNGYLAVRIS